MKTLICTVGLPRSGKSTWAREQGHPIVNPDAIRLALYGEAFKPEGERMVWTIAEYMVKSLFGAGHDFVILDATNTTETRRDEWRSPQWVTKFKVFRTDAETCKQRAVLQGQDYLLAVIDRMDKQLRAEPPEKDWQTPTTAFV